jgi:hypothetical protein
MTPRRSAQDWAALVGELDASGLSVSHFAARQGLSARTLAWWRWKVRQGQVERPDDGIRFVELAVEPDPAGTAIVLRIERFGMEIEIRPGFDPELLRTVVGALC